MKKEIITIIIILLLIITTVLFKQIQVNIAGKIIQDFQHSYTKAICNQTNHCQDYIISCQGGTFLNKIPIENTIVQHKENWVDPRNKTEFCQLF